MSEQQTTQKGQHLADLTEEQAREHLESLLWENGAVCYHCGGKDVYRMEGETVRAGLWRCRDCEKQFTVTLGTIFEDSKIPLRLWIRAFHLMCSSKKGISALQLQRNLGLGSYRTAWHLAHRIRTAMQCGPFVGKLKGKVQVDETHVGSQNIGQGFKKQLENKTTVIAFVSEDAKRSMPLNGPYKGETVQKAVRDNVEAASIVVTDGHPNYKALKRDYDLHMVPHRNGMRSVKDEAGNRFHTGHVESSFSLLKRGVYGVFHHISKKHMQRYCDEFDFRWNERKTKDVPRTVKAIGQARGKRLMIKELMPMRKKGKPVA